MTKAYKGGITGIVVMIPVLMLVTAMMSNNIAHAYGFKIMILAFLAVNMGLAFLCSDNRTAGARAKLFAAYCLITLASTVLLAILLFFIGAYLGLIPFKKIGG